MKNYYEILQLKEDATLYDIRAQYKKLTLEIQPKAKTDPVFHLRLEEIVEAYEILRSPFRKRKYDLLIDNQNSSSKRRIKHLPKSKENAYKEQLNARIEKSKKVAEKIENNSTKKVNSIIRKSEPSFAVDVFLEFILSMIAILFD
ncbi:MAG: DnaJ domain-containing protein [Saprospiraceae bacterium]|nr:DnaJ domain-containing protein [Saprospiraceae bacterium]